MSNININFNIDGWGSSLAGLAFLGFKDPVQAVGGILKDCINEGRTYLQEIFQKCREARNRKNLTEDNMCRIDSKFIVSWIQSAMFEGDKILQELWARLLVNAGTKDFRTEIRVAYIDIIKSLTSLDVKILDFIRSENNLVIPQDSEEQDNIAQSFNTEWRNIAISVDSLKRLRLVDDIHDTQENIQEAGDELEPASIAFTISIAGKGALKLTALGQAFLEACS